MKLSSFFRRVFAKADVVANEDKPLTLRITGVGVAHVDPGELLRSKKAQQQMDAADELFEWLAARKRGEA